MFKTTVKIAGMMCGMCEAHIQDTIRKAFPDAKKVNAFHGKGYANFLTKEMPDENRLMEAIEETGYSYVSSETSLYEKKGLFG